MKKKLIQNRYRQTFLPSPLGFKNSSSSSLSSTVLSHALLTDIAETDVDFPYTSCIRLTVCLEAVLSAKFSFHFEAFPNSCSSTRAKTKNKQMEPMSDKTISSKYLSQGLIRCNKHTKKVKSSNASKTLADALKQI